VIRAGIALAVIAAACGTPADDCQRMVERSAPMFAAMARAAGREIGEAATAKIVAQCRRSVAAGHRDPALDCVLAARDDAAVHRCYLTGSADDGAGVRPPEARLELARLARHATAYFGLRGEFPGGTAAATPPVACCDQPGRRCAVSEAGWAESPVWTALAFQIDRACDFQYRYQSDGQRFIATASGDPGCDGHRVTYAIEGSAPGGNPQVTTVEP